MKKTILLIVACAFAFVSAFAQNSEVEALNQLTKAEQFKTDNSLVKEAVIYEFSSAAAVKVYAKLFTDLKNGEQITALEFHPSGLVKALSGGAALPLGYLDMDKVDDFILALEKMLEEHNNADKKDKFTVSYTAPGGIDAYYTTDFPGQPAPIVLFRKKWFTTNEYGVQTSIYSSAVAILPIKSLTNFISSLKEAQTIANQSLGK